MDPLLNHGQAPAQPGHSPWGASSSDRWLECAGSVEAHAAAPRPSESEFAAEGDVAHDLLEQTMRGKLDKVKLMALIGTTILYNGVKIKVTGEMVDGVLLHFDTVLEDFNKIKAMGKPAPIQILIEHRVVATSVDPKAYGTLDSGIAQKGNILIIHDFKFGQGKLVEAENNPQGLQYLISVIDTLGGEAFDEIWFVVVQPRVPHSKGRVRRWLVAKAQIQAHRERMKKAILASQQPNAPRAAGPWCRWCNAYAICTQARSMVQNKTGLDFAAVKVADVVKTMTSPEAMTPETIALMLESEEVVNKWFKAIRTLAQYMEETKPGSIPRHKIVEGRPGNRVWTSEKAVVEALEDIYSDGIYEPKCLRSPADLEVVVGKKLVAELTTRPPGKKTIAPDSDYRAATTSSAVSDFKDVDVSKLIAPAAPSSDLGDLLE